MKKRIYILCGIAVLLAVCVFAWNKKAQPELNPTRTYREGMTYGGQNCIMYHDLLYWEQSLYENPPIDQLELVGTVEKAADALPKHNFESAVTAAGAEIYYTDNNPGVIVVKEDGVYYMFGLQANSETQEP